MNKYDLLAQHLKEAKEVAKPLLSTDDGGTCNLDTMMLYLPRWRVAELEKAARTAGFSVWAAASSWYRAGTYMFSCSIGCQGNARTRFAEKLRDEMKRLGYEASVWYHMD